MMPSAKQKNGGQKNWVRRKAIHIFLPAIFLLGACLKQQRRARKRASAVWNIQS
jgi:hypothetical protein